jgi:hypothetical protein
MYKNGGELTMCNRAEIKCTPEELVIKLPKKMELNDTVSLMNSSDYRERFQAEYYQTKIRYDKLCKMLVKHEAGTLGFTPTCPIEVLEDQKYNMEQYLKSLQVRAELEKIELD